MNYYEGKDILVTGGVGSIGSQLVKQLVELNPKKIRVLDQNESGLFYLQQELKEHPNIRYLLGDIRNRERIEKAVKGVDIIFHSAALKHVPACEYDPIEAVYTNILGTQNIIDAARNECIERCIAISTDKAVNPSNTMGATKLLSEKLMSTASYAETDTIFSCVRFGNVLRSNGSVIPLFKSQIEQNQPVTVTSETMTRFFMSLGEAVSLVLEAGVKARGKEIFILKMKALKIIDLAQAMIELSSKDIPIKVIGKRPGEKEHELLLTDEEAKRTHSEEKIFVLHPEIHTPHYHQDFKQDKPILEEEYNSHKAKHLTKEEIKRILTN